MAYVVAALIWWFISLEKQNRLIAERDRSYLLEHRQAISPLEFETRLQLVDRQQAKNTTKHLSEGITF